MVKTTETRQSLRNELQLQGEAVQEGCATAVAREP